MTISLRCLKTDSSKNGEKRVSIVYAREHVTVKKSSSEFEFFIFLILEKRKKIVQIQKF